MSDETTLLRCPLCDGEVEEPISKRWTNCLGDVSYSAYIRCDECNLVITTRTFRETEEMAKEDAIAAWNTRAAYGTLTAEQVREAIEGNAWAETSTLFEFGDSSWQAIADELNIALGNGECELTNYDMTSERMLDRHWVYDSVYKCSKCGETFGHVAIKHPQFCPECGRKAVKR